MKRSHWTGSVPSRARTCGPQGHRSRRVPSPPDRLELPRHTYRLAGDHPVIAAGGLLLETAVSAPWFGQPGGAPIHRFLDQDGAPLSVRELLAYRLLTDTTTQEIPA